MTVNERIKCIRKQKGITSVELARQIGVDQSTIIRYENGAIKFIQPEMLDKLSRALNCKVKDLTADDYRYASVSRQIKSKSCLSPEDTDILNKYHSLPTQKKKDLIIEMLDELKD